MKVCSSCNKLELTVDKFLIGNSDIARSIGLSLGTGAVRSGRMLQLNSGKSPTSLGTVAEIRLRHEQGQCALCSLVATSIQRYSDDATINEQSKCLMEWEVDGRRAEKAVPGALSFSSGESQSSGTRDFEERYSNVSRRIRFWWQQTDGKTQEAYLLFVPPADPLRPNADALATTRTKQQFLARDYGPEKSSQALIKSWLDLCDGSHGAACDVQNHGDAARFKKLLGQTSFGVIDVVKMQLTQLPVIAGTPAKYIALSYVWGPLPDKDHRTLRENVMQRIQVGGIEDGQFPQTIRDAIQLTRNLGERYMWIDALCIVQDSPSSWRMNAANMDLVYGNAYLTICAADGFDSREGLAALDPLKMDTPLKAEYSKTVNLLVSRPSESVIRDSVWNRRAWTFQERILSRRCLVFADRRFYFQCRSINMAQDIYPEGTGTGWSSDWKNSPLRTLSEVYPRPIWFYMTCVSLYTGRSLTKEKDILHAFNGVSRLIERRMHEIPLVHGLPPSHFDLALLWEPLQSQRRRVAVDTAEDEQTFGGTVFPSWSWSGWIDSEDDRKGSPVKYKQDTLEGCFVHVHEWLMLHTWIRWFIRNVNGDLRPIWSREHMPDAPGVLPRWRGYRATARTGSTPRSKLIIEPAIGESSPHYIERSGRRRSRSWQRSGTSRSRDNSSNPPDSNGGKFVYYNRYPPQRGYQDLAIRQNNHSNDENITVEEFRYSNDGDHARPDQRLVAPPAVDIYYEQPNTEDDNTTVHVGHRDTMDEYGRVKRPHLAKRNGGNFCGTIPDNPFGVNKVGFETLGQFSDQTILQFWTWRSQFYVLTNHESTTEAPPGNGLARCDVADQHGDWCGHIVLDEQWIREREGQKFHFIAISEAKSFTKEECRNWTNYIPRDPEDVEWDLFFTLLITWNSQKRVWERVGLGKVFTAAFDPNRWDEIVLG